MPSTLHILLASCPPPRPIISSLWIPLSIAQPVDRFFLAPILFPVTSDGPTQLFTTLPAARIRKARPFATTSLNDDGLLLPTGRRRERRAQRLSPPVARGLPLQPYITTSRRLHAWSAFRQQSLLGNLCVASRLLDSCHPRVADASDEMLLLMGRTGA